MNVLMPDQIPGQNLVAKEMKEYRRSVVNFRINTIDSASTLFLHPKRETSVKQIAPQPPRKVSACSITPIPRKALEKPPKSRFLAVPNEFEDDEYVKPSRRTSRARMIKFIRVRSKQLPEVPAWADYKSEVIQKEKQELAQLVDTLGKRGYIGAYSQDRHTREKEASQSLGKGANPSFGYRRQD
jgi:hypothetical protein